MLLLRCGAWDLGAWDLGAWDLEIPNPGMPNRVVPCFAKLPLEALDRGALGLDVASLQRSAL